MISFMFFLFSSAEVIEKRPHLHRGDMGNLNPPRGFYKGVLITKR
jgi:hypothetical protein